MKTARYIVIIEYFDPQTNQSLMQVSKPIVCELQWAISNAKAQITARNAGRFIVDACRVEDSAERVVWCMS